jgi:hypothetical protein
MSGWSGTHPIRSEIQITCATLRPWPVKSNLGVIDHGDAKRPNHNQQLRRMLASAMGWTRELGAGPGAIRLSFSRSGAFRRHIDRGVEMDERFRLSGRHLRLVVARPSRSSQGSDPS